MGEPRGDGDAKANTGAGVAGPPRDVGDDSVGRASFTRGTRVHSSCFMRKPTGMSGRKRWGGTRCTRHATGGSLPGADSGPSSDHAHGADWWGADGGRGKEDGGRGKGRAQQ